jgi:hypothetical protein
VRHRFTVALVRASSVLEERPSGTLMMACQSHDQELSAGLITPPWRVRDRWWRANDARGDRTGALVGAVAIVSGGLDDADLESFLGYNLGVAITGSEKFGIYVIVTEGFGEIAMAKADVCAAGPASGCRRGGQRHDTDPGRRDSSELVVPLAARGHG